MRNIRALHTEADYEWALKEIERYFENQPSPGTPEGDRFDVLSTLLKNYEDEHHDIPDADPIDILNFAIEELGRSQADLARIFGSRPRASEILNRKRALTLEMIRKISEEWHLPIEALSGAYELTRESA
jgi:HTH-type transcriptional regulator / antitoxin HigA